MQRKFASLTIVTMSLIILLVGCTLPAPATPTPIDQQAIFTSAAETVLARLTVPAPITTAGGPALETPSTSAVDPPSETEPLEPTTTTTPSPEPVSSPTATETQTVSDSPTPSPTTAPASSDPRDRLGNPDFRDTFTSEENWSLFDDEHVSFDVAREDLEMTAFNSDSWDSWMLSWPTLEDFYIEITATQERCSGLDRYGVMVRATDTSKGYVGYLFGISCDGRYSLRRWNGDKFVTLIDWTTSDRINASSDQTNRIGLLAEGDSLGLYANGSLLEEIEDDSHEEGRIGVFLGSVNTEDFTVQVDEVAFWELP